MAATSPEATGGGHDPEQPTPRHNDSGTETYYAFVEATDPIEAVHVAQREAVAGNDCIESEPDAFVLPLRQRSRPDTAPKPQTLSHESMMVADHGPQTAGLATTHFIPASRPNG